jgi:tRNA-specific 2-thiouridylase
MQIKKVFVGLSGGVDSAVSALLLKRAGYDVTGVYIKGWQPEWIECTWKDDRISAMRTAAHLDIPFLTLDGEAAYRDNVAQYMLREYSAGRTPNGDMLCNREVKFGIFLKFALENGADYIATGHYAQNLDGKLFESVDKEKDQTYFLSQLTQTQLKHALFPIGHLQKSEVRKLAEEAGLPVATRKDSQGICFVGDMSMEEWLKRELKPAKGDVLNMNGEKIGEHDGAVLYTLGQRHGYKIFNLQEDQQVYYVVKKNIANNTIAVDTNLSTSEISENNLVRVEDVSFVGRNIHVGEEIELRFRYRGEKVKAVLENAEEANSKTLIFKLEKNILVTPGQFAVFYKDEECLGGGVIA